VDGQRYLLVPRVRADQILLARREARDLVVALIVGRDLDLARQRARDELNGRVGLADGLSQLVHVQGEVFVRALSVDREVDDRSRRRRGACSIGTLLGMRDADRRREGARVGIDQQGQLIAPEERHGVLLTRRKAGDLNERQASPIDRPF
jgi:hypothetical protein